MTIVESVYQQDFNDPWDSGKVGHIVCTKENLEKIGLKNLSVGKIKEQLEKEVKEYSDYLEGNKTYYYFSIFDKKHNLIDSCSGYKYENLKDMLHEMSKYDEEYIFLFNALLKKENQNYFYKVRLYGQKNKEKLWTKTNQKEKGLSIAMILLAIVIGIWLCDWLNTNIRRSKS